MKSSRRLAVKLRAPRFRLVGLRPKPGSLPQYLCDAIKRASDRLERYADVVDQVGRLPPWRELHLHRARGNQLSALFAEFFQAQIAVEKQLARVASPVCRRLGV